MAQKYREIPTPPVAAAAPAATVTPAPAVAPETTSAIEPTPTPPAITTERTVALVAAVDAAAGVVANAVASDDLVSDGEVLRVNTTLVHPAMERLLDTARTAGAAFEEPFRVVSRGLAITFDTVPAYAQRSGLARELHDAIDSIKAPFIHLLPNENEGEVE